MPGLMLPDGLGRSEQGNEGGYSDQALLVSDSDFDDDKKAVAFVDAVFQDGKRRKSQLESNWHHNIQFYQGNQWLRFDRESGYWQKDRQLEFRSRYKANLVATYVMTRAASLLKDKPKPTAVPATEDVKDVEIAKKSSRILTHLFRTLKMYRSVMPSFAHSTLLCGTGVLKVFFDPTAGPAMAFDDEDEALVGEEAAAAVLGDGENRSFAIGEAKVRSVSPFSIFPDPNVDDWDSTRWILEASMVGLDEVRDLYPKTAMTINAEGTDANQPEHYRSRVRGYSGDERNALNAQSRTVPSVMVKELWVRPCRKYPAGYRLIVAGSAILSRGPLPKWTKGELPYYVVVDKLVPLKLWGGAVCDDLRDINKARNFAMSQIIDNAKLTGNPPIRKPRGSRIDSKDLVGQPGAVWNYVPVGPHKPEYANPPSLPGYVQQLPSMLEGDSFKVTGMNEPTMRASAPSNVRTASGLAALLKQDEGRQAITRQMLEETLSSVASCLLRIVAYEYKEERIGKVIGDKNSIQSFKFTGEDILGAAKGVPGANYFDVDVKIESGYSSKEAQKQFYLQMAQLGIINIGSEEERKKLLRLLDVGSPEDSVFGEFVSGEEKARRENSQMALDDEDDYQDEATEPSPVDDHELHLKVLVEFMRSEDFSRLPKERKVRFAYHKFAHEQLLGQQAAGVTAPGVPAPGMGQPPPPGQPGSGAPSAPGFSSMPGKPEEPKLPSPPDLAHTPFAGM